jgi:predicted DNA binding protein
LTILARTWLWDATAVKEIATTALIPAERIERAILLVRSHKVILDSDLAALYGVRTKRLNEQVRRNRVRFPPDFMFQLTDREVKLLRSQTATSKSGRGGRRYRPYVFTEHGALMAATVLNSQIAVRVSVQIVRAFVRLRQLLATHAQLARQLADLERRYDAQFKVVFDAIKELMTPPQPEVNRKIGFRVQDDED